MFRKFVSTVMMVLIASMVFASPPNEKNMTNTKANDNALMTTADTDMSSPPPTLQVWTDSTATETVRNEGNDTVQSTNESKRDASSLPAVAATKFKSESFEISHMTNMTASTDITATTTDDKEESSPAVAATNTMTAETAPMTSTQMGHLATEGDFPLKFI